MKVRCINNKCVEDKLTISKEYIVINEGQNYFEIKNDLGEDDLYVKNNFKVVESELVLNTEMVNHPNHYNQGKFEVIDVIKDWKLDFNLGNAVKYIARCEHKGKYVEDLKKAMFYIQYAIDHAEVK